MAPSSERVLNQGQIILTEVENEVGAKLAERDLKWPRGFL